MSAAAWITPYGTMLVLACIVAWWLARRRAAATGLDPSHVDLALPLAFIAGAFFAGALGWFLHSENLVAGTAFVTGGRRRLYATVFVVLPVLFAYCRLTGVPVRRFADVVAVPALAFMAIVRIGCFLAGCCFGDVSGHVEAVSRIEDPLLRLQVQTVPWASGVEWPWAIRYPIDSFAGMQHAALGLIGTDATTALPIHPVQLYETLLLVLFAAAVVRARPLLPRAGGEALLVLSGYATIQFLLEFLRADNALVLGPLTLNQLICAGWLAIVALLSAGPLRSPAPVAPSGRRD